MILSLLDTLVNMVKKWRSYKICAWRWYLDDTTSPNHQWYPKDQNKIDNADYKIIYITWKYAVMINHEVFQTQSVSRWILQQFPQPWVDCRLKMAIQWWWFIYSSSIREYLKGVLLKAYSTPTIRRPRNYIGFSNTLLDHCQNIPARRRTRPR